MAAYHSAERLAARTEEREVSLLWFPSSGFSTALPDAYVFKVIGWPWGAERWRVATVRVRRLPEMTAAQVRDLCRLLSEALAAQTGRSVVVRKGDIVQDGEERAS